MISFWQFIMLNWQLITAYLLSIVMFRFDNEWKFFWFAMMLVIGFSFGTTL
jgi:hypothetical protein